MTPRPVAQVLVRFGPTDPARAAEEPQADVLIPATIDTGQGEDGGFSSDIEADGAEGETKANALVNDNTLVNAEALSAACAEHVAALAQERLLFEARLAAERAKWTREESEKLNEKLALALAEIETNISGSAARALRPFLIDLLRRKAIDDLAESVGVLLGGKDHPLIEISGAKDLLDALREKLSDFAAAIDYAPRPSVEVKVVADQTIIDSRIEAWIERIKALPE